MKLGFDLLVSGNKNESMLGQLLFLGIKGPQLTVEEARLFKEIQPGGYILFSRNIESAEQVRKLTDDLRSLTYDEPFIAIDNEGGRVWRTKEIGSTPPSAAQMSEKADLTQMAIVADQISRHLQILGINMNFGPVLDIDHHQKSGAQNALRGRCYGTSANEVLDKAGLTNRRFRFNKLLTCGKHFPSCGLAQSDPHHDLPIVDISMADLQREDLIPYMSLLPEMNAIMTAHVTFPQLDPKLPATLSPRIIDRVLRDIIGFKGVAITDDLDMGAIVNNFGRGPDVKMAIEAGNDMALICHQTESAPIAYKALQEVDYSITDKALARIKKQKKKIPQPLRFTAESWEENNDQIAQLRKEILGDEADVETGQTQSPVEDY